MKRFIFLALFSLTAHAQFNDSQKASGVPNNALSNPGFEAGLAGWVKSGGNWSLSGVVNSGQGKNALAMEFTAADQTLKTALTSIPRAIVAKYGGACMASFVYFGGGGNTYEYYVEDSSSNVVGGYTASQTMFQITSAATDYARPYVIPFVCDEDETYRLVIKNKTASTQTLYVDNAVLGGNDGIGTVAQASLAGRSYFAPTASCLPARTNTAIGDLSTVAACPGPTIEKQVLGSWQTTDADYIQQTINNLPAGEYELLVVIPTYGSIATAVSQWVVTDGTTTSGYANWQPPAVNSQGSTTLVAQFSYSSAGNRTFKIQCAATSGTCNIDNAGQRTVFQLKRYPTSSETVARLDAPGVGWTAFTPTGSWVSGTSTYTGYYQCTAGNLSVQYNIAQSGAPTSAALTLNLPSSFTVDTARLAGGAGNGSIVYNSSGIARDNGSTDYPVRAGWNSSTSLAVYSMGTASTYGNNVQVTQAIPFTFGSPDNLWLEVTSIPVTDSSPCPKSPQVLIPGSVYSSSAGIERTERAIVGTTSCTASPCTIAKQSGSWLTSITRNTTGTYTLNIASGTFSDTPSCVVTASRYGVADATFASGPADSSTPSATAYSFKTIDDTGTLRDSGFHIQCQGPR